MICLLWCIIAEFELCHHVLIQGGSTAFCFGAVAFSSQSDSSSSLEYSMSGLWVYVTSVCASETCWERASSAEEEARLTDSPPAMSTASSPTPRRRHSQPSTRRFQSHLSHCFSVLLQAVSILSCCTVFSITSSRLSLFSLGCFRLSFHPCWLSPLPLSLATLSATWASVQ